MAGEIEDLRAELAETRQMVEDLAAALCGRRVTPSELEGSAYRARLRNGNHLWWLDQAFWRGLEPAGFLTLEEVAARRREEIAAIRGVGPKTMAKIDAALSVEGLSYAEGEG